MKEQEKIDYQRIADAIQYLQANFRRQPSLDEVARQVHLSTFHFQRLFTEWAGVSPKKFLQYLSIGYAKSLLKTGGATLFDTTLETGLSGTGRLHDLFINIEGMTPAEYKDGAGTSRSGTALPAPPSATSSWPLPTRVSATWPFAKTKPWPCKPCKSSSPLPPFATRWMGCNRMPS